MEAKFENRDDVLEQAQSIMSGMLHDFDVFCQAHDLHYWMDAGTLLGAVRHGGFIPWDDDVDLCMPREDFNRLLTLQAELPDSMHLESHSDNVRNNRTISRLRHRYSTIIEPGIAEPQGLFVDVFPVDNYNPDGTLPKGFYICKRMYDLSSLNRQQFLQKKTHGLRQGFIKLLAILLYLPNKWFPSWHTRIFSGKVPKRTAEAAQLQTDYFGYGYEVPWNTAFRKEWVFPLQRIPFDGFEASAPHDTDAYLRRHYGPDYMTPIGESGRHKHFVSIHINLPEEDAQGASTTPDA